jgi:hypothetical protein
MHLYMVVHAYTTRKLNKKVVSSNVKNLVTKRSQSNEEHYPSVCVSVEPSVGALPHEPEPEFLSLGSWVNMKQLLVESSYFCYVIQHVYVARLQQYVAAELCLMTFLISAVYNYYYSLKWQMMQQQ